MTLRQAQSKKTLKKYGIKPLKKLGQNFLIDKGVLKKIINAAELSSDNIVLEIGPGLGILTLELARKVKKVIAIEKDKRMCEALKDILKDYKNVEIINKNALDVGSPTSNITTSNIMTYKLVANLPYYITSPVIRKFLEAEHKPKLMILMVQKQVAQRIVAKPGKMSILSVAVQFYADVKIISYVSKKSFYPVPKVDSAIIKIVPRSQTSIDTEKFFDLVKKGFSSKRKMLKNNLGRDIGSNARAQELSIEQWLSLYYQF